MKKMLGTTRTVVLLLLSLLSSGYMYGNISDTAPGSHPVALGLQLGSQGLGLEGKVKVYPHWNLRLGISAIALGFDRRLYLSKEDALNAHYKGQATNIHLLADWETPFWQKINFRFTGGLAYFNTANVHVGGEPAKSYKYGDLILTPDDIGRIDGEADWHGLAPYLGIGLLRAFPARKWGIGLDLGSYFFGKPDFTMTSTKHLRDNAAQDEPIVKQNLSGYRWLPLLQISLNYKL